MASIVVIGSSNTDMVVKSNHFPKPGETIIGGEFFMFSGGKGANQAVAAARAGGAVSLIAKTGDDIFGQRAITELRNEGIDCTYITADNNKASGVALIIVDEKGENEIVVAPGANDTLHEEHIEAAYDAIKDSTIILFQLEIPLSTVLFAAKKGKELNKKIVLNPAPATILPTELFACLYLITPNETEAEILTGIKVTDDNSASKAADKLLLAGVENVIITMGAAGAYFKNAEMEMQIPSHQVTAVDTTAAGDVFNGVLVVELAQGCSWEEAIRKACKAASISVTRMGAQASMPFKHELI
jgi:ribokinase